MGMPTLIGAGVGAAGSLITGRDPLKGAMLGAALGSGVGAIGGAGAASAATGATTGAGAGAASVAPTTAAAFESSMGLAPTIRGLGSVGSGLAPNIAEGIKLSSSPNLLDSGGINFDLGAKAVMPSNMMGTGTLSTAAKDLGASGVGGIDLSQVANMSPDQLALLKQTNPSLWEKYSKYLTPSNMIGAKNVADQFAPQPLNIRPSGGEFNKSTFNPKIQPVSNVSLLTPQKRNNLFLLG